MSDSTTRCGDGTAYSERYTGAEEASYPDSSPEWELPPPVQAQGTFRLRGTIGTRADDLAALPRFARERRTLVIDMGEVERVEFHFLHALQEALAMIAAAGRRVIIANAGEITSTLLIAVGAERHAVVMRRKPPAAPARLAA